MPVIENNTDDEIEYQINDDPGPIGKKRNHRLSLFIKEKNQLKFKTSSSRYHRMRKKGSIEWVEIQREPGKPLEEGYSVKIETDLSYIVHTVPETQQSASASVGQLDAVLA